MLAIPSDHGATHFADLLQRLLLVGIGIVAFNR